MVRRLPQLAAGLAALALVGSAVGAQAQLGLTPGLTAVPDERGVSSALGSREVSELLVEGVDLAGGAAADRESKEAAERTAEVAQTEAAAVAQRATEKRAAEKKADAKKAAEKKAAEKQAAEQADQAAAEEDEAAVVATRQERTDRSTGRPELEASDLGAAAGSRWTTVDLNARTAPAEDSTLLDVLADGSELAITERTSQGWQQIELDGRAAWVAGRYLVEDEPAAGQSAGRDDGDGDDSGDGSGESSGSGSSGGECASGSGVESGLQPNAVAVHRSICHAFPAVTSFGGVRADSVPGHPDGRAVDAMLPDYSGSGNALGWQIAEHVRANAGSLGVTEVIFDQKIWTTQRSGEGWRTMSDRGGDTANHRDHVHVTVS